MNDFYDAIWYGPGSDAEVAVGPNRVVCQIVDFKMVGNELYAVALPMTRGVPFARPASEFKVTDEIVRSP
ncbi:MAG TPA: hypothetical protein VFX15_02710 [Actinomycetes bacterium]|nr:hypothetical protein [Actinomycetes bacterium]